MITGKEKPDSGEDRHRPDRASSRSSTSRATRCRRARPCSRRSPAASDILTVGKFEMPSRAYLGRFNFKGADQQKIVGNLSGGERGRLHLAKTLIAGGNVLLLDEPSNDLDVETLRALEDALLEFAGCVLVISHDRWFLDRIATHILAFEGDSQVDVLRRQLPGIRSRQEEAPRRRRRPPEAHPLQGAEDLSWTGRPLRGRLEGSTMAAGPVTPRGRR